MPYLGHENFREVEVSALSLQHKASQTVPFRKVFRAYESSVAATTLFLRDNLGSQVLYLPIPTTGTATGVLVSSVYGNVAGTTGGAANVISRYSVTTGGVVTVSGTALIGTINSGTFTVTANNTVTGVEVVAAALGASSALSVVVTMEVYPMTPIEELYGYRTPATAALATIEGILT